ncbi:MAG: hypothetical protein AB7S39_09255 [Gemmatimonadales bacterium]
MRRLALAVALMVLAAGSLAAQQRRGFFLSLGMGGGSAGLECPQCGTDFSADRVRGVSGYLRVGGAVSPSLQVGIEGSGWLRNSDAEERRLAAVSLVFVGYPGGGPFFLRAGVGGIRAAYQDIGGTATGEGLVGSAGIGIDIPVGAAALTPYATFLYSTGVAARVNGTPAGLDLNPNLLQVGLAVTIP